jgi:Predicted P-loop-containing kinase
MTANDLVIIGGVSGSGKSVALTALEDAGYYIVSHLPPSLLAQTVDRLTGLGQRTIAMSLSSKIADDISTLDAALATLRDKGWNVRLVFLDAKDDTLVKRFSETRRRHPFSDENRTLTEAISEERQAMASLRERSFVVDTSDLPASALRTWVKAFGHVDASQLLLLFESFGFKHGVPLDADIVFDVRCLPNPHYETALRSRTGRDEAVAAFLENEPQALAMYRDIRDFIERWLPDYRRDGRSYLTVAIGCTGGRHRSVYLVEKLTAAFRSQHQVMTRHRELSPSEMS